MVPPRPYVPASAEGDRSHWRTIGDLLPYLWPKGEPELRLRVAAAVGIDHQ